MELQQLLQSLFTKGGKEVNNEFLGQLLPRVVVGDKRRDRAGAFKVTLLGFLVPNVVILQSIFKTEFLDRRCGRGKPLREDKGNVEDGRGREKRMIDDVDETIGSGYITLDDSDILVDGKRRRDDCVVKVNSTILIIERAIFRKQCGVHSRVFSEFGGGDLIWQDVVQQHRVQDLFENFPFPLLVVIVIVVIVESIKMSREMRERAGVSELDRCDVLFGFMFTIRNRVVVGREERETVTRYLLKTDKKKRKSVRTREKHHQGS